jgi:16S rRNA (guanine966-N2)-methyltransferase
VRIACLDALMPVLPVGPFLDLFAGAGGVGIEALSRGAPSAVFVERDALALRALRANLDALGLGDRAQVIAGDAAKAVARLARTGARFAVVFLDPPYESEAVGRVLGRLAAGEALAFAGIVVVQHPTKAPPVIPPVLGVLEPWRTRRFGETTLTFLRAGA